ncbi:hypothetical protein [Dactylosporangium darangshiense]|uniref:Uncharacterized protein n=1 Tax=Dactylosporangium darangshiense TaxID=579108 RepID=A0ABP8DU91_9ACTN
MNFLTDADSARQWRNAELFTLQPNGHHDATDAILPAPPQPENAAR